MANLKLVSVLDPGTDKERVLMRADGDLDLGNYIVTDTTYKADGQVSNKARHVYEFAPKVIEAKDLVVLYSKKGTYQTTTVTGTLIHQFYWGLNYTIWNQEGDNAWLLFAKRAERQVIAVPATKK